MSLLSIFNEIVHQELLKGSYRSLSSNSAYVMSKVRTSCVTIYFHNFSFPILGKMRTRKRTTIVDCSMYTSVSPQKIQKISRYVLWENTSNHLDAKNSYHILVIMNCKIKHSENPISNSSKLLLIVLEAENPDQGQAESLSSEDFLAHRSPWC